MKPSFTIITRTPFFALNNIKQASKFVFFQMFIWLAVLSATASSADAQTPTPTPTPPPIANDDFFQGVAARRQLAPALIVNDSGGGQVRPVSPPSHSQNFGLGFGGEFNYIPAENYIGTDSFQYKLCIYFDTICSQPATVTLQNANTKPIALPDIYFANAVGAVDAQGYPKLYLNVNDFDLENDGLEINTNYHVDVPSAKPAHGWVILFGDGRFIYHVNAEENNFRGVDTFEYQICDYYEGYKLSCSTTKVFVVVGAPGDPSANLGTACPVVGQPVNVINGNMWLQQTDYSLPGIGAEINLTRTYNSARQAQASGNPINNNPVGIFGLGWSTQYEQSITAFNDNLIRIYLADGRGIFFFRPDSTSDFTPIDIPDFHAKITKNTNGSYTLKYKDGRIWEFNATGGLVSMKDRNNNQITLSYDSSGNLIITDAFGRTLTITFYDSMSPHYGLVHYISDALGTIATYEYYTTNPSLLQFVTYQDGSKYEFIYDTTSAANKTLLKTVKDANGNILETHDYDSQGRATTSEKQGGVEKYTFNYLNAAETDVTDANGKVSKYYFDKSAGRDVVKKAEGVCSCGSSGSEITEFTYDAKLNLTKKVVVLDTANPQINHETTYTYDLDGNILTQTEKVGTTNLGTDTFTYNTFGQILTYKDKVDSSTANNTVVNVYDASGNLKTTTDALGNVTTINYPATNNKGLPDSIKDARNKITKFDWHPSSGLLKEVEDPYGKKTSYIYDARGRVKTATDALTHVTTYNYFDDAQRKVEIIYANSDKITYKYDIRRLLESVTDERGKITTYTFDNAYHLTRITDPLGHYKEYDYDLMSNLKLYKDGSVLGNQTDYEYDDFNRLKKIIYPLVDSMTTARLEESFEYDKLGRIKKVTGTDTNQVTNYVYDDALRTTTVTNAELETTTTKYNARSQMIQVIDAKNQIYDFTYDLVGRLWKQTKAGATMTYDYDAVGNLEKRTDYMGRETTYEYDNLNRLKQINYLQNVANTYPSPTPIQTVVYTYDELSRLKTATNEAGTVSITYDNRNRIKDTTDVFGHLIEYNYTPAGDLNRKSLKFDGVQYAQYNFDDANRLTSLVDSNDSTTISFGYDNADKLISKTLPNAVTTTYDYDGMSRLKRLKDTSSTATLFDRQYYYNAASQINSIAEPTASRTFTYDNVDRLTGMVNATSLFTNESYSYDDVGNRTASHRSASYGYQQTLFNQNQFNRLTSTDSANYNYDVNGNMTTKAEGKELWRFTWDYENRLTTASTRKQTVRYRYDALGRRVQRYIIGGKENTKFIYDGQDVLVDDNNGVLTKYQNGLGIDNKLKMTANGQTSYFLTDHLGSTNALTDSSGNVTSSASYDSFGNATGNLNTRYQFTGREFDNFTGLHYYRARWYDSNLGRFISEDPIGLAGGLNTYGYVGNSPNSFTDPSGLLRGADISNWIDKKTQVAQDFYGGDPVIAYFVPTQHPIRLFETIRDIGDMFRIGEGLGCAYYADDENIWGRLAFVAMDVKRFSDLFTTLEGIGEATGAISKGAAGGKFANPCLKCFEAGTEVQTDEGLKPIEKIETGDKVLSYNENTGLLEYREVLAKFTRSADDIYSLRVEGESEPLGVTSEHPFFVRVYRARDSLLANDDDGEWRETQNLQIGDEIRLANGTWAKVLEVIFKGAGQVYNFTVAGNHNYFVGDLRLLTHNTNCGIVGDYLAKKAPKEVTPGTKTLEGQYVNDVGRVEPWVAHYDQYGRQIARTDFNAGNKAAGIPDIHHVIYEYNQQFPMGRMVRNHIPGEFTP